jgi:quinol-cytochrome oxidoreductase complex cytochrome b subunit
MKANKLVLAIFKAILCMVAIFVMGYLGYHYPDAMIWVITAAILCAFSRYFYTKGQED